jgi:hypothetical protein
VSEGGTASDGTRELYAEYAGGSAFMRRGGLIMVRLEFDPHESTMMNEILQSYLSDLRMEIADTEKMAFREDLKKKEVFIKGVMERIEKGLMQ